MTADDLELLADRLGDPWWRLTSGEVYKIKTADGRGIIPFIPREEQKELLRKLLDDIELVRSRVEGEGGWTPQEVELKARRLGYSTTIGVFVADCLGFRPSFTAQLIDQTADDAAKKMNGIVKVALNALIEIGWPLKKIKDNDSELTVDALTETGDEQGEPSSFFAGVKGRGGSCDLGWYSELGVIQYDDPPRAEEIVTGAFPAAQHGVKIVETTWKGGKGGKLWDIIQHTLNGVADDWRVHFSPWFMDPRNVSATAAHDAESLAYFASIEERLAKEGIIITDAQRRWYAAARRTFGIFMMRENPTFLDECWRAPIEGSIYGAALDRARVEGRVCPMPIAGNCLVNTSWDLGAPSQTAVWYWQITGREIRIIDYDAGFEGTLIERVAMMKAKGYSFDRHYLPHDAMQTERTASNFATEIQAAGLANVVCVPRTASVWIGINHVLEMMPGIVFRSVPTVEKGLEALAAYRKHSEGMGALTKSEPVHDWASHPADAFRTMAEAHRAGLFKFASAADPRPGEYGRHRERKGMKPRRVSA